MQHSNQGTAPETRNTKMQHSNQGTAPDTTNKKIKHLNQGTVNESEQTHTLTKLKNSEQDCTNLLLIFFHKLTFSNLYIYEPLWRKALIFQTQITWS